MAPNLIQTASGLAHDSPWFRFDDSNLLRFEQSLSRWRNSENDIWLFRDSMFGFLAGATGRETRLCFRLGVLSYLPRLFLSCIYRRRPSNAGKPPIADYLVFIGGAISKEFDTLQPLVAELAKKHNVLVLWVGEQSPTVETMELLHPAKVWHVRPDEPDTASRFIVLADSIHVLRLLCQIALACRHIKGIAQAFWNNGAQLFDYLIHVRLWERFLTAQLADHQFSAVAFASDVNPPGKIVAKMARRRGCRSHHFLHGFPGLVHTWSIASDIHVFTKIEEDYFLRHGWSQGRVHARGHPRQCSLARQIQQHRAVVPADGDLHILFAGQHAVNGSYSESLHHQTLQTLLEAVARLQLTPTEFRVRLHPGDDPSVSRIVAARYAPHLGTDVISNRSVSEDLAWANVVVTVSSTMAIEACYAGCHLIWLALGNLRYEIREQLVSAGYGRLASSATQLYEALLECRDERTRGSLRDQLVTRGRELGILNPDAAKNAAESMTDPNRSL